MLPARNLLLFAVLSVVFAGFGRAVRGVTTSGAITGAIVCFALLLATGFAGFAALLTVFLVTWASTRFAYVKKQRLGTAEAQSGRNASQVAANLGTAALCAIGLVVLPNQRWLVAIAAALAEAAADTVSSEIGQAIGGEPRLVTSWKRVAPGTNGAVTLFGSLAGAMAAAAVALVCYGTALFGSRSALVCAMAGISGMVADSFFGATVERRELLGNNGVNFISTAIAAAVALVI